mmetsp:Transcript_37343/g.79639  ORF Transcript_37343/g.79639 Transcript_37343/m.79639 type:complete len:154 (-) Transcript_37343:172-633(-)
MRCLSIMLAFVVFSCSYLFALFIHQTKQSYLRKEMTHSGDLSTSRSRSRRSAVSSNPIRKPIIVAVEPDSDDSKRGARIDQGLLDASKEAQNQVLEPPNKSWWTSYSPAPSLLLPQSPLDNTNSANQETEAGVNPPPTGHRRTVSYNKTYRVP